MRIHWIVKSVLQHKKEKSGSNNGEHMSAKVCQASRSVFASVCVAFGIACALIAADPPAAPPTETPAANLSAHARWVIGSDFTEDNSMLVTVGGESLLYRKGEVVIWNVADGSRAGELVGHPTSVWAVDISKDGKLAATTGYDGLIKLWDFATKTSKADLKKHLGWVRTVQFSTDSTKLATGGEDGTLVLWDALSGAEIRVITAHAGPVSSVCFSPDGTTLASGSGDKLVKLWDVATGMEKGKLEGHTDGVWTIRYSPDGSKLVSTSADRTAKLWTTSDAKEYATLVGHKDWVTSAAFTPDGARLATGSLDGVIKFWDVASKAEQIGPEKAKASVWSVSISPDGGRMFVGSHADGRLLPIPEAKLAPPPPPPPPMPPMPLVVKWTTLVPTEFKSTAAATAAITPEGVVTVTGPLAKDTYQIKAVAPAGTEIKGIRLETLADPSLPGQGPGRSGGGNFVVSRFAVSFGPPGSPDAPSALKLESAKADFEQEAYGAAGAIDDNAETGWAISGGTGKDHSVTFQFAPDTKVPAGGVLLITIDQQHADGMHAIGKLRLSTTTDTVAPSAPAEKPVEKPAEK